MPGIYLPVSSFPELDYKSVPPCLPLYIALGVELGFSGLQGKHFSDGDIFPVLVFFKTGSYCSPSCPESHSVIGKPTLAQT